ncbi:NAD(P)/FAD-dependent oxidoreductase [Geothrix sp. 21YS21S-2]|uniref:NAD(P)/FAD-dependent oxidoreductase n=1 Tax=Geothrix sp. 21YS21S-2 TaxID=3068893 RepID=UPI0027B8DE47|nr:FAD-dependent oxidoreductase [Geothrix sp. 21YS21S-2]
MLDFAMADSSPSRAPSPFLETIVVGAGVAGLSCAGALKRAGREVLVLERAHGVGGRCATRRFDGQPVDFGPLFAHGHHPGFLQALREVDADPIRDWPRRVEGGGPPCQPGALEPTVRRIAFAQGMKAFPRHLAKGLEIHLETRVTAIRAVEGGFEVTAGEGAPLRCRDLVLALALEQSRRLLGTLEPFPQAAGLQALLGLFGSVPCLAVMAGYALDAPAPAWDVLYPEASEVLQLVALDSSKREAPRFRTFVAQARPKWSRQRLEAPLDQWGRELLDEAALHLGPWAAAPLWSYPHRWRYARLGPTSELAEPLRIDFPGGARLGLAGDVFSPGGGLQAAWLSGTRLAGRLTQEPS